MPKSSPIADVANQMAGELDGDVKAIKASLESEIQQVGASKMTRAEYLTYVYRNWADPGIRAGLLKQHGNAGFLELAQDVVKAHGHPPIPAVTPPPMLAPPTMNSAMPPAPQPDASVADAGMMGPLMDGGVTQ